MTREAGITALRTGLEKGLGRKLTAPEEEILRSISDLPLSDELWRLASAVMRTARPVPAKELES